MDVVYTGYPFIQLGDPPGVRAPIRQVEVLSWEPDVWVDVRLPDGQFSQVKKGYLFRSLDACTAFEEGLLGSSPKIEIAGGFVADDYNGDPMLKLLINGKKFLTTLDIFNGRSWLYSADRQWKQKAVILYYPLKPKEDIIKALRNHLKQLAMTEALS